MAQRHTIFLPVLASLLLLNGCVPNKIYRPGPAAIEMSPTLPGSTTPAHFKLGVVEFDDMGESWEKCTSLIDPANCQLTRTVNLIRQEKSDGRDVVVVVFVHGWKNNASPYNEAHKNLHDFEALLEKLATGEDARITAMRSSNPDAAPTKPRSYIGVYLAWRGQAVAGDLFSTFWNRRDAAARVGSSDFAEAVYRIMAVTKENSPNSRIVVVGHSFGARALETAITNTFVSLLIPQPETDPSAPAAQFRAPADLILYVNAATDSFRTKQMIELMKRTSFSITRGRDRSEGPLFLSVTSTGDSATGLAFPIGQDFSKTHKSFRSGYDGNSTSPPQQSFFTHTPGHVPYLFSHTVTSTQAACTSAGEIFRFTAESKCYEMAPVANRWNDSPFWVMTLPTSIIPDHSSIFKPGFAEMITQLVDHYEVLNSPRPTTMVRSH